MDRSVAETIVDEHGDFKYTLRQFLLMRRLHQGGDWTEVYEEVRTVIWEQELDPDALDTYRNWQDWYNGR